MAAPTFPQEITKIALDYRTRYYELNPKWAQALYEFFANYNFNGAGGMPDFTYVVPISGEEINFSNGSGEIRVSGTPYSSMTWEQKTILFKWERQFIRKGLLKYSETYNI